MTGTNKVAVGQGKHLAVERFIGIQSVENN